jgi:carbohydrate diacid regulator
MNEYCFIACWEAINEMIISHEVAQKIVDQLMDIAQRNVNIMDCNGMIIASGQHHRINTFHQGAKSAALTQDVIEIQPNDVELFPGALPGVMWPIDIKKKIVGVVCVTGEPNEVRHTAKLIKTVTELVLEREMFLADYRSENSVKAQLVNLLFSDNPDLMAEDIQTLAEMLNYKLNLPRMVILLKLEPLNKDDFKANGLQNLFSARVRESVLNMLKTAPFFCDEDISLFYKKHLCIIKSWPDHMSSHKLAVFTASIVQMFQALQPRLRLQIGIGSRTLHEYQLRQSYDEALFALEFSASKAVSFIHDQEILLNYLFEKQWTKQNTLALQELKHKFEKINDHGDMEKTIKSLLANNLNISAAASQLFIHRNTLKFRLEKLKKAVGLDPCHSFHHAMLCEILLHAE